MSEIEILKSNIKEFFVELDKFDSIKKKLLSTLEKQEQKDPTEFETDSYEKMKFDIKKIRQAIKDAYSDEN